jgi:hypothetical protein
MVCDMPHCQDERQTSIVDIGTSKRKLNMAVPTAGVREGRNGAEPDGTGASEAGAAASAAGVRHSR